MGESKNGKMLGVFSKLLKQKKFVTIIMVVGLAGIVLIFLSDFLGKDDSSQTATPTSVDTEVYTTAEYEKMLEEKIYSIVSKIGGAGEVQVMVTIENGAEYVYVTEEKKTSNGTANTTGGDSTQSSANETYEENVVLINGQKEALVQKVVEPKIRGVVIVCEGAESSVVKQNLTQAVTTAFDISANRVYVAPGQLQ